MASANIKCVLSQLIQLTAERDSGSLELAMAQTLFNLAAPDTVTIVKVIDVVSCVFTISQATGNAPIRTIPSALIPALKSCCQSKQVIANLSDQHQRLELYPLLNSKEQVVAIIVLEAPEDHPEVREMTVMLLEIYKNFVNLMHDNERDTLTGLLNRKTFDLKINKILHHHMSAISKYGESKRRPYFLAIFDIDHFKQVNDTFGHLLGDEVLLLFSRLMTQTFREHDELFRFGGEEFIALFQCEEEEMTTILERFRQAVQGFNFPQVGQVTVSIGYSLILPYDTSSVIIDRADAALYFAKSHGRNQVCCHETLLAQGAIKTSNVVGEIELF